MLASVTNTPEEVVDEAMKTLQEFGLIKIDKKGTIVIPRVLKMVGSASNSDAAQRQRRCREKKKERDKMSQKSVTGVTDNVTKRNESIEYRDKSIENRVERNSKERKFTPPTLEEVKAYCQERNSPVDAQQFFEYYEVSSWKDSKGNPVKNWKQKLITWEKHDAPVVHCATPQKSNPYEIDWSKV